ncbi:GMC family oxidoreductase N-terminal domain-containing protein [Acaryochloris sp. IP29b_bin.148]|uniref:GMC family oxidoreductase N-terminal domain-containing protein n=1 Tax=Acaryochloris sp. IP29b_bin.148 TaxID=2969218 RepID=UPI00261DE05A|nr:GMC family oxidoreductase N-terminal domain-containing protein [Acaryochloris sp. IP29b_bin.148]
MVFDYIVVGSGNGACGFLSRYIDSQSQGKVLVLEEGENFFYSSDIAHQLNWLKSFAEGKIYKLHNAQTPNGIPIISGRACTMGGGGSINYTMIHESSEWLSAHVGQPVNYWQALKQSLNQRFKREDPTKDLSPITEQVLQAAEQAGFRQSKDGLANIPNHPEQDEKLLHLFPTLFNPFGQRTHSGVSIVNWFDDRITLRTQCRVQQLEFETTDMGELRCCAVHASNLVEETTESFALAEEGKVILCAGAGTPRLLLPHKDKIGQGEIGHQVSDHILLPLGLYLPKDGIDTTPKDNYVPVFATTLWREDPSAEATVCTFDFFAGEFDRLIFLVSHLFLALLLPNWLKRQVIKYPKLFFITKNAVRILIQIVAFLINGIRIVWNCLTRKPKHHELELVTAILKFKPRSAGYYVEDQSQITLDFFAQDPDTRFNQDKEVAKTVIKDHMDFLNALGDQPHWLVRGLLRCLTRIPYTPEQVEDYVETYSRKFLLTEQHLAGGCLYGSVLNQGLDNPEETGKVVGTHNVHVADLSSVPLPRVSPQMTAYLLGFHVAEQLCCGGR